MKKLTIALLLSFAPAALKADNQQCLMEMASQTAEAHNKCNGCDRTESTNSQDTENLQEFKEFSSAQAAEKTRAIITISTENTSTEKWEKIQQYVGMIYGEATAVDEHTVCWELKREGRSTEEWLAHLSNIKAVFVAMRSTVANFCDTDPVTVTIELQ